MKAIDYANARIAELPKLWDSRDTIEASDTAWIRLFEERIPSAEVRRSFVQEDSSDFYFHEYPNDRVLLYRENHVEIYGTLPKPPIDWTVEGPQLLDLCRGMVKKISNPHKVVENLYFGEFTADDLETFQERLARFSDEP